MIETMHPSVLHGILGALPAASSVRLAACAKSLHHNIMTSPCQTTLIPILRERLKDACWSLLCAGYEVNVRNTLACCILQSYTKPGTFQMLHFGDPTVAYPYDPSIPYCRRNHMALLWVEFNDIKTFRELFDMYIIHSNARLQRSRCKSVRNKKLEKHFARCAENFASCTVPQVAVSKSATSSSKKRELPKEPSSDMGVCFHRVRTLG